MLRQLLLAFSFLAIYISSPLISIAQTDPTQPNILLIIADDMGTDMTPGFLEGPLMPTTPFLDTLREEGLAFTNCWATPQCTPTRASIISGKYGTKTGIQQPPGNLDATIHSSVFNELNIQNSDAYDQGLIGKWHISNPVDYTHPGQHGLDYYSGVFGAQVDDYYEWDKVVAEALVEDVTTYATTDFTNDAINWINSRTAPWLLTLSHIAPHVPFHLPPASLYSISPTGSNKRKYIAAIEAMDSELQRLKESVPTAVYDNTIVIFIGDNGTPTPVVQSYPSGRGKGTIYQGGINVPLIVAGPGVTRLNEYEDALVNATDLYATILEMAGGSLPGGKHNSYSFYEFLTNAAAVGRPYNYIDYESDGSGGDEFAIRDEQYKLLQFADGSQEFYDLLVDSFELIDLLSGGLSAAEQIAYDDLVLEAYYIRTDWSCRDLIQNGSETSIDINGTFCGVVPACIYDNSMNFSNIGCCAIPNGENEKYEIEFEDVRTISTNNFPDHAYCYNNVSQIPTPTNQVFYMDATPTQQSEPTSILNAIGRPNVLFGLGMNGVVMAPAPATPFIFENANTGEYNWNWVFEPTNNQGSGAGLVGLDCASAHTNTGGHGYHYHGNMFEYVEQLQSGISTTATPPIEPLQVGWAADGYPIFYRFGPDGAGGLALLEPSFALKAGDRPGDGVNAPCGPYNGKYTNDYKYDPSLGDLDECNGVARDVTVNTVCGPRTFDYFYMVTDSFPQIGRCHVGTTDQSFISSAITACLVRMEIQEVVLNNGASITVGSNTYDQIGEYRDTVPGSNACDSIVITKITAVLPLSLISFEAINREGKWVDLVWETLDEAKVSHFEIERSYNALEWEKRGMVTAKGNTTESSFYQYQDDWSDIQNPSFSTVYYRLKMVDEDGSIQYSNIKSVNRNRAQDLGIFHDRLEGAIYLETDKNWIELLEVELFDLKGRLIQSATVQLSKGKQLAFALENLPANLYFVSIKSNTGLVMIEKIVVTK